MNPRYHGPEVLPPAAAVRKRVEEHLESLPAWELEPRASGAEPQVEPKQAGAPGRSS